MTPDPGRPHDPNPNPELTPFLRDAYERLLAVLDILEALEEGEPAMDPDLPSHARQYWNQTVYEAESVVLFEIQDIAVTEGSDKARVRLAEFYEHRVPEQVEAFSESNPVIPKSLKPYFE